MNRCLTAHEFALYMPDVVSDLRDNHQLIIRDKLIVHRIKQVLRLEKGETVILFDRVRHARCIIDDVQSSKIIVNVQAVKDNGVLLPIITVGLPVLKKDDLSQAISLLTEVGVNNIQLLNTDRSRAWGGEAEYQRLERVAVAAMEQSKYFVGPIIHNPIDFASFVLRDHRADELRCSFDVNGQPIRHLMQYIVDQKPRHVALLVGPEADFTMQEQNLIQQSNFTSYVLTPTVLRAAHAVGIASGFIRSLFIV